MNKQKPTVLFILCTGHSGSTLLDIVLGQHRSVIGLGECERIASSYKKGLRCACGQSIKKCSFWGDWFRLHVRYYEKGFRRLCKNSSFLGAYKILMHDGTYSADPDDVHEYKQTSIELYKYSSRTADSEIVVDSSKNIHRFVALGYNDEINPVILHLVRDVRGVTFSYWKKYGSAFWPILKWIKENVAIFFTAKRMGVKRVLVRYENLANNPEKTLRSICKQLNIVYDADMLAFNNKELHQPAGNRIRFEGISEIKHDQQWKNKLPTVLKIISSILAGWLLFVFILEDRLK